MANYTVKAIMKNFEEMLIEMPFSKVTVSALVERCEISSNTFYYHFRDIYELLNAWLTVKEKKYINIADGIPDWPESLKLVLKVMQENSKLVYHIFDSIPRDRLERFVFGWGQEKFYEVAKERIGDAIVSEIFVQKLAGFYCYSVFGFVLKFLWDHMKADVDEAVNQLSGIFYGVTDYMIAKETGTLNQNENKKTE
ncbi:MAG: TetR/AcrR family transcriptional regulator C-terminal domain-containing protein [Monoglobaceae bacterium]